MKISVIVPVFNERESIEELLSLVIRQSVHEILVVDDCSTDGTKEYLSGINNPLIKTFFHEKNRGKGAAVRTALGNVSGDIVIIQDADLEYDPEEYDKLTEPILKGRADVVYGTRFKGVTRVFYFWHYLGNKLLTLTANLLFNSTLSDMETCYKAFMTRCAGGLVLKEDRWGFDPEITAHFLKKKYKIVEVPISYYGRTYEEGKKIRWIHGFRVLYTVVKCRFSKTGY